MFRDVGIGVLVKQGARIRDVKVGIIVNVDVTVGVEDSKITSGCDGWFGERRRRRRIAGADGRRFGVVDGDISGGGVGGVWVGGYVQRPAVGSDGLWRGGG